MANKTKQKQSNSMVDVHLHKSVMAGIMQALV